MSSNEDEKIPNKNVEEKKKNDASVAKQPLGGWGGFKNLGQSIRQQAEELSTKVREEGVKAGIGQLGSEIATPKSEPTPTAAAATNANSTGGKEYSKAELMDVLQKMNKRVKALSALRVTLTDRVKIAESDKMRLMSLMKDEVLTPVDLEEASVKAAEMNAAFASQQAEKDTSTDGGTESQQKIDEIKMLQLAWNSAYERNQMTLQQIQNEYKVISMQCQAEVQQAKKNAEEEKKAEIEKLRLEMSNMSVTDQQNASNDSSDENITAIREKYEEEIRLLKEEISSKHAAELQNITNQLKAKNDEIQEKHILEMKQLEETSKATVIELQSKIKAIETDQSSSIDQLKIQHQKEIEKIKNEIGQAQIESNSSMEKSYQSKIEQLTIQHAEAIETCSKQAQLDLSTLKQNNEQQEQTKLNELKTSLTDLHNAEMQKLKTQTEEQLANLKNENARSSTELEKFIKESEEKLEKEVAEVKEVAGRELKETVESTKSSYENEITTMKVGFEEQSNILQNEMRESKESEIAEVKAEMQSQIDQMNALLVASNDSSGKYKQELEDLRVELEETQVKLSTMAADAEAVAASAEDANQMKEALEAQRNEFEKAMENIKNKHLESINAMKMENEVWKTKLSESSENLKVRKQTFEEEQKATVSIIEKLKTDLKQMIEDRDATATSLRTTNGQVERLQQEKGELEKNLKQAMHQNDTLVSDANDNQHNFQTQNAQLNEEIEKLKQKHAEEIGKLQSETDNMINIQAELENANAKLALELEELSKNNQNSLEEQQEKDTKLTSELQNLKETLNSSLVEKSSLSDELQRTKKSLNEIETKLASILTAHQKEIDEISADIESKYSTKIESLVQKQNKAIEVAKKIKEASTEKLKSAEKSHAGTLSQIQTEHDQLISKMNDDFQSKMKAVLEEKERFVEIEAKLNEEVRILKDSIEKQTSNAEQEKEAYYNSKSEELEKSYEEKIEKMRGVQEELEISVSTKEKLLKETIESYDKQFETLKSEHVHEIETRDAEESKRIETMETEFASKMTSMLEQHSAAKSQLEQKMTNYSNDLKEFFQKKIKSATEEYEASTKKHEAEIVAKNLEIIKLNDELKSSSLLAASLNEDNQTIQNRLKLQITAEQQIRQKLANVEKNLKDSVANNEATAQSLLEQQDKLEEENKKLRGKIDSLTSDLNLKLNDLEEINGKHNALTANLNFLSNEKSELEGRVEDLKKSENKLKFTEAELNQVRQEVNKLKLEQTKSSSLLSRLQIEKEDSERKHGQRTALVGMLEAQLAELNEKSSGAQAKLEAAIYDLNQKDDELRNMKEQLEKSEKLLSQYKNSRQQENEVASQKNDKDLRKKAKMVESLQKEVLSLQQQMARKSSAAQRLLKERETECKDLRKKKKLLQEELDKGTLSDRRIFELAAQQSNRESVAASEIKIRETLVQRLTDKLATHDSDLASAEYSALQAESQVEELCRVRRREDINIDYLKSIVVQYLSKPPGSSERAALLPVIATLLQFDQNDYKMIEEGKNKVSFWGTVLPTYIAAPQVPTVSNVVSSDQQTVRLLSTSAEVTVSNPETNSTARSNRSSLQF